MDFPVVMYVEALACVRGRGMFYMCTNDKPLRRTHSNNRSRVAVATAATNTAGQCGSRRE